MNDLDGGLALVATRDAIARVILGVSAPVDGVDGELHVRRADGTEIPGSPFRSYNGPILARVRPDPLQENETLNFIILRPPAESLTLWLKVTNPQPQDEQQVPVGQQPGITPLIGLDSTVNYVLVDYRPDGGTDPYLPSTPTVLSARNFYVAAYPVSNMFYEAAPGGPLVQRGDINVGSADSDLLNQLAGMRTLMEPTPPYLFGWLPAGAYRAHGLASWVAHVAFANADPDRLGSFAHEMGHLYGLGHDFGLLGWPGQDVNNLIGLGRYKSPGLFQLMYPGLEDAARFIKSSELASTISYFICRSGALAEGTGTIQDTLWVSGGIDQGGRSGFLNPAFERRGALDRDVACRPTAGGYSLSIEDEDGQTLAQQPFDVSFEADSEEYTPQVAAFGMNMPDNRRGAWIVLRNRAGDVLDRSGRKPQAPDVALMSTDGEVSAPVNVYWEARDPDGDGRLWASMTYSPDLGQSWIPLAVSVPSDQGARIELDPRQLPASPNALIRLLVTDGWNTRQVLSKPFKLRHAGLAPEINGTGTRRRQRE